MSVAAPLLDIRNLQVEFATRSGLVTAVAGVTLDVHAGECLAVVGESGSGKSQLFLAALGLLPENGRASGSVRFGEIELLGAGSRALRSVRGARIGMVFQDPLSALTPHLRIEDQLLEVLAAHGLDGSPAARPKALEALSTVGIDEPERRLRQYPHELSGGMRQRVAIAAALIAGPELLIADEPTTALDVTVQAQIVDLLRGLRRRGLAIVFISHDLPLVAGLADRIAVMYAGRVAESGPAAELCHRARHPYTQALLRAVPGLQADRSQPLAEIEGQPRAARLVETSCPYEPRCPLRFSPCATMLPELRTDASSGASVACHAAAPGARS
jgi:oligopeptide/dipeptide ABC transporter ATP-binding protein